jgi:acetyl-CoA C-acetyltransferase
LIWHLKILKRTFTMLTSPNSEQNSDPIVITSYARTPIGSFQGAFSTLSAPILGAAAINAALERSALKTHTDSIDEVLMGCVLTAGIGQAPARQASILAGLPYSVGCTTVNKMCGSGMKALMLAHDLLLTGDQKIMVAGGMEHMTNAPYLLDKARSGYRMGHATIKDHLFLDGLEDAYDKGMLMGVFAERTAEQYGFSRKMQDDFALTSLLRAQEAIEKGWFNTEITPVTVKSPKCDTVVSQDELPGKAMPEKIPNLKPAFKENGTVTAANSSSISDGAAALVLMRLSEAKKQNIKPLAKILGHTSFAQEPGLFTTAPCSAIKNLLNKIHWNAEDVDLYEINEAFAVVTLAAMHDLQLSHQKVNIHGGACALGHPIGASGARIICTLLGALQQRNLTRGIAALCIGGGEATAIALERY